MYYTDIYLSMLTILLYSYDYKLLIHDQLYLTFHISIATRWGHLVYPGHLDQYFSRSNGSTRFNRCKTLDDLVC